MTFVNITALAFPEGAEAEVEKRFAARQQSVDNAEGFQEFELLRPAFGDNRYLVVTKWDSREQYDAWADARPAGGHTDDERRGMSVEVLGYDVVSHD